MTLVEIDLSKEPPCLKVLQADPIMTYGDLKDDCGHEVKEILKGEQKNLCAYCQKSIESVMTIEHYIAQTDAVNNGHNLQLNFSNFFGVCLGQFRYDRFTRKTILHCDSSRGNIALKIDPRKSDHISTISYTDDFKIVSSDPDFTNDLDTALNLNIDGICDLRQKLYNDYLDLISNSLPVPDLVEFYQKALRDIDQNPSEYYGYIKFRLEQLLENEINRSKLRLE